MDKTCGNCRYFRMYECHRHPPVVIQLADEAATKWPHVEDDDWCGEHELTKEESAKRFVETQKVLSREPGA